MAFAFPIDIIPPGSVTQSDFIQNVAVRIDRAIETRAFQAALRTSLEGDVRQVFRAYDRETWLIRAFVRGRWLLCPMASIVREVPLAGRVLDIGCGHGLLAGLMASGSAQRQITAIDPSAAKLAVAKRTVGAAYPNISIHQSTLEQIGDGPYDAITLILSSTVGSEAWNSRDLKSRPH